MNTKFFIKGRWYKTPCKTVLNAECFTVEFFTGKHTISANVSNKKYFLEENNKTLSKVTNKIYFVSIDGTSIFPLKRDFHFARDYTNPQNFLSSLYDTFAIFLNTFISDKKCPLCKNTDEVLERILEITTATEVEAETATEAEETTDPEIGEFVYDVGIHNFYECRTYTVRADNPESAVYKALKRMKNGKDDKEYYSIDFIRIHKENLEEKSELKAKYGVLADDQFHPLTRTLIISLFKAIGIQDTRKIHFTISNGLVFFNYKGNQYKYYSSQCKIFKKRGRKYQRINWKDFAEENNQDGQKHTRGRSPPLLLI